jgi:hypothetical protein
MDRGCGPATPSLGGRPIVVRMSEFTIKRICSAVRAVHRCWAGPVGRSLLRLSMQQAHRESLVPKIGPVSVCGPSVVADLSDVDSRILD